MQFENLLKDKSEITRKTYIQKLNLIKKKYFPDTENFDWIKKSIEVIKKIKSDDLSDSSKKLFFNALYSVSQDPLYHKEIFSFGKLIDDKVKENKVKPEKLKEYVSLKELKKIVPLVTDLQDKLLISLYVLQPPLRNDYAGVKLLKKNKPYAERKKGNYMVMRPKSWMFYLNEYKNVAQFGPQKYKYSTKFNPEIYKILLESYEVNPREYLIEKRAGYAMSDGDISKRIQMITKKYINKTLSINDIRKIYETDLINSQQYKSMNFKQKEAEHRKLLHSFTTAHSTYHKTNITVKFD